MHPPPADVYVVYDGTKVTHGLRKRVKKKFPGGWGRNGLKREVKVFCLERAREGKRPAVLGADGVTPLYGPQSEAARREREERRARELAKRRALEQGTLFDTSPDQLPD